MQRLGEAAFLSISLRPLAPSSLPWALPLSSVHGDSEMENPDPVTAVCCVHPGGCLPWGCCGSESCRAEREQIINACGRKWHVRGCKRCSPDCHPSPFLFSSWFIQLAVSCGRGSRDHCPVWTGVFFCVFFLKIFFFGCRSFLKPLLNLLQHSFCFMFWFFGFEAHVGS